MKENKKGNILLGDVKMDTQTFFHANGDINIYPCSWEADKDPIVMGKVRYEGGIEVDADGHTKVKRWNRGSMGPKHETLFETPHAAVKMTRPQYDRNRQGEKLRRRLDKEDVYVIFRFPKKYGMALMKALYAEESDEIMSFFKTRKEETKWE